MHARRGLIVLDRDGVLNQALGDPGAGCVLSPLSLAEVEVFPWVKSSLARLTGAGFTLAVATNQPAWKKGQSTLEDLVRVHTRVLDEAQSQGAKIADSYICYHRAEDDCSCRKPRPGLLEAALKAYPDCPRELSWMVGDRATDVMAGAAARLHTALLGIPVFGDSERLQKESLTPDYRGSDLRDFVEFILTAGASDDHRGKEHPP